MLKAKARLVAKGFSQRYQVDFLEVFSPTASAATIRILVALANIHGWDLSHFDVEQAFVQSKLDYEVYMRLPPGCGSMTGNIVLLNKALYGLKQSARQFYKLLVSRLVGIGFEQCLSDPCILRLVINGDLVGAVVLHVDDIIFGGASSVSRTVVDVLNDTLPTKHLGDLSWYMGVEYKRDKEKRVIELSQTSYIRSVLERFDISRSSSLPAAPSVNLRPVKDDNDAKNVPFREVVGCLMWIANQTRPDIANAVRAVARHSHDPKEIHWKAAQKILQYLRATADLGLIYRAGPDVDVNLSVYADADYAKEDAARRSVSGGAVLCGGSPVAWFSRTQKSVTLSTTEAEYVAMGDGVKEALFVHGVLEFLSPGKKLRGIRVLEDNEGAIALAENPISSSNSKHIDVRHHFLSELVENEKITVEHVSSEDQHADILTKALPSVAFIAHRNFLLGKK